MTHCINQDPILLYLWKRRTLYLGELPSIPDLTPAASTLLVGLDKPFLIWDYASGQKRETRTALVPAGTHFGADPRNQNMVNCYLDPLGEDLRALSPMMQGSIGPILVDCRDELGQLEDFRTLVRDTPPAADAYGILDAQFHRQGSVSIAKSRMVEPIQRVIDLIQSDPLSNEPTEWLAHKAGLTQPQLNRWFKRITGVPVRRYRLWHRLFVTANLMSFGKSLTDAAHEAGFSDSSHLNHTFRSMIGMTPSFVFQRSDRLRIFTCPEH